MIFCCKCCKNKYNTEQSITQSKINCLYDELIKKLYLYNSEDYVDMFKKAVEKYKEQYYYINNKNLLLFIIDISHNMFTFNERCIILKNNEILLWALNTKRKLKKKIHCGYGSSCNSSR